MTIHRLSVLVALGLTLGGIALGGCGSSKPAYRTQVSEVKNAVQELPGSVSSGPSAGVSIYRGLTTAPQSLRLWRKVDS